MGDFFSMTFEALFILLIVGICGAEPQKSVTRTTSFKAASLPEEDIIASIIQSFEYKKLATQCAALCLKTSECVFYQNDAASGCRLIGKDAGCREPTQEGDMRSVFWNHQGALSVVLDNSTKAAEWSSSNSPLLHSDHLNSSAAIDGNYDFMPSYYLSKLGPNTIQFGYTLDKYFPWIQVDLGRVWRVKTVLIFGRNSGRNAFFEIRIGMEDITDQTDKEISCKNQLCTTKGDYDGTDYLVFHGDCATQIRGQFITVQKYAYYESDDRSLGLEMNELDVEVVCEERIPFEDCLAEEVDSCARMALAAGKSGNMLATKGNWRIAASTNANLDAIIDADAGGPSVIVGSLYHDVLPWIQIDLAKSQLVNSVQMHAPAGTEANRFVQVRIGDDDVAAATKRGLRICKNALCKTTGRLNKLSHSEPCSSPPLPGRFVVIQNLAYLSYVGLVELLELAEVDIVVYE